MELNAKNSKGDQTLELINKKEFVKLDISGSGYQFYYLC